jgi:UTP--glucose-1-phosphate uridylyltransferase
VIITAAGLDTRLLPMSKELPKEILPIYIKSITRNLTLKPMPQTIFKQFYEFGNKRFLLYSR